MMGIVIMIILMTMTIPAVIAVGVGVEGNNDCGDNDQGNRNYATSNDD